MSYHHPKRPRATRDFNSSTYENLPYADDQYLDSPQHGYRKDNPRTPPRGPAGDRIYSDRYERDERIGRERSLSPRREGQRQGHFTDLEGEGYWSPPRNRSRSPYFGGPPNRNVILEGLPVNMTQEDDWPTWPFFVSQIMNELQRSMGLEGLEEVRLIRDKRTGLSRQFAFAQFVGIPEARRFLEQYYPAVPLFGGYDPDQNTIAQPTKVRIAFSREDRERPGKGEDDWKCEVCYASNFSQRSLCYRCNAPRTRATAHGVVVAQSNMSSFSGFPATGDSDASPDGTASQFLLLRGLEPGVNEELLAKGASKLCKTKATTGAPADVSVSKRTKVSSTSSDSSMGAKDGSLRRVLLVRDRKSNDSWRYGFAEFNTVEDAQAAMTKYKASEKFTISSKPVTVSYIHAGVFVPVLHPLADEVSHFTFSPLSSGAINLMYWDEAAYASELEVTVADRTSVSSTKEAEHAKLAAAAASEGLVDLRKNGEPRQKKRKIEKDSKTVAPHLKFWNNRHAELHGTALNDEDIPSETTVKRSTKTLTLNKEAEEGPPSQTFADLERKCCLLCSRQFKTEAEVNKHERISQLHRDNMKDETLVAKATAKVTKLAGPGSENSAYRDRAKERRQAFNQPKQPAAQHNRPKTPTVTPTQEEETPAPSKGAALLGKMGWTAGEGLGAQGTGRTGVIATELYAQGVGLGAQGGKVGDAAEEAQRQTKGNYADFLNNAKSKAKERFESLG